MVGAVIVGHGQAQGEAHAAATAVGPVVAVTAAGAAANAATDPVVTTEVGTTAASSSIAKGWYEPWQLVALSALVAGIFAFVGIERRRRDPATA
jgi:uncharacterized membrane protein YccC